MSAWDDIQVKEGPARAYTADSPMPWGKHAGTPLSRVPPDYLRWAVRSADKLTGDLRRAVLEVLGQAEPQPLLHPENGQPAHDVSPSETGSAAAPEPAPENGAADLIAFRDRLDMLARENVKLRAELAVARKALADARMALSGASREIVILQTEIRQAELRAQRKTPSRPTEPIRISNLDRMRIVIKQWFRAESLLHHPDRGGSKEKQALINTAYQDLMKRLEEIGS
jgi:hypothetical protein